MAIQPGFGYKNPYSSVHSIILRQHSTKPEDPRPAVQDWGHVRGAL